MPKSNQGLGSTTTTRHFNKIGAEPKVIKYTGNNKKLWVIITTSKLSKHWSIRLLACDQLVACRYCYQADGKWMR